MKGGEWAEKGKNEREEWNKKIRERQREDKKSKKKGRKNNVGQKNGEKAVTHRWQLNGEQVKTELLYGDHQFILLMIG